MSASKEILRLDHINLVVCDLEAAEAFFVLFGYTTEHKGELSGEWISEVVGLPEVRAEYARMARPGEATFIELIRYDHPAGEADARMAEANRLGLRHFAFAVDDLEGEVRRLRAAGVRFRGEVRTYPATGKKLVYAEGPEGVVVELAQYAG